MSENIILTDRQTDVTLFSLAVCFYRKKEEGKIKNLMR